MTSDYGVLPQMSNACRHWPGACPVLHEVCCSIATARGAESLLCRWPTEHMTCLMARLLKSVGIRARSAKCCYLIRMASFSHRPVQTEPTQTARIHCFTVRMDAGSGLPFEGNLLFFFLLRPSRSKRVGLEIAKNRWLFCTITVVPAIGTSLKSCVGRVLDAECVGRCTLVDDMWTQPLCAVGEHALYHRDKVCRAAQTLC